MVKPNITYHWDFEFQGKFEVDIPEDQRPYLALAGGLLHGDIYGKLAEFFLNQGSFELIRKRDFRHRDRGFSRNRAIRGADLRIVRVIDKKKGKPMMAMPDVVDYRNDRIIDLKTYYLRTPPDEGGIFITVDDVPEAIPSGDKSPNEVEIPKGYEDAWSELKVMIQAELDKKYNTQFERYHHAYFQATGRIPTIHIYVVLYTATKTYEHDRGYGGMRRLDS